MTTTRRRTCSSRAICSAATSDASSKRAHARGSRSGVGPAPAPSGGSTTPAGTHAYRNNLDGTFREMAAQMGLSGGASRDVAYGDFDGDGRTDLVVVGAAGRVQLFHSLGQGRFEDVTAASGLATVKRAGA